MQWSSQICFHTLATAHINSELPQFLEWYVKSNITPNITKLGMVDAPSGRGRKGRRAKCQCSTKQLDTPIWNVFKSQPIITSNNHCHMVLSGANVIVTSSSTNEPSLSSLQMFQPFSPTVCNWQLNYSSFELGPSSVTIPGPSGHSMWQHPWAEFQRGIPSIQTLPLPQVRKLINLLNSAPVVKHAAQ